MVVIDLVPLLGAFLAFAVCYALLVAYRSTIGALLAALAKASYGVSVFGHHPFHWLGDGIESLNSTLNKALTGTVNGTHHAWAVVLHANAVLWHDLSGAVADLAVATEGALRRLPREVGASLIPAWIHPLRATVHYLQKLLARLETKVANLPHAISTTITHETTKVITKVERVTVVKIKSAAVAIPRAIGIPLPRVGALERDVTGLEKWVRSHRDAVTAGALAAAVAATLARLGLSSSRCSRVQKYNKALCGMNDGLLDSLLADTLVLASTISIVELAVYCQGFLKEVEGPLESFVRELRDVNPVPGPDASGALANFAAGRY